MYLKHFGQYSSDILAVAGKRVVESDSAYFLQAINANCVVVKGLLTRVSG